MGEPSPRTADGLARRGGTKLALFAGESQRGRPTAGFHPARVKSLSLHSPWHRTDAFLKTVVEGWQIMARASGSVADMILLGISFWCFTPEFYNAKPDYIQSLADFVRSRPAPPLEAFLRQSNAVVAHDVESQLGRITAPTLITFGGHDLLTSTRFSDRLGNAIRGSEVLCLEECAHTPIYQAVEEFNQRTLAFLRQHAA